jgi:hypothetical protein
MDGYDLSKQLTDAHNHKEELQDQLCAFKIFCFFLNLHNGDGFATDVVKMGGPMERPIEIRTSAIVLDFSLTHASFVVSLQYAMAIILKRS